MSLAATIQNLATKAVLDSLGEEKKMKLRVMVVPDELWEVALRLEGVLTRSVEEIMSFCLTAGLYELEQNPELQKFFLESDEEEVKDNGETPRNS